VGHPDAVFCLAYSPDGKTLASGSRDPTIRLWNIASREARLLPAIHTDRVAGLSFSPDGQTLASASYDRTICLWDVKTGQPRWRVAVSGAKGSKNWLTCVRFSPDGTTLAAGADDGIVRLWGAATGQQLHSLQASGLGVFGVSFSPDGRTLACASNDNAIHLLDVRPKVRLRQYLQAYRFDGLDLMPVPAANLYGDSGFRAEAVATFNWSGNHRPPTQGIEK
jgi:WD40 repeat protein